jgi:hypothetical protein
MNFKLINNIHNVGKVNSIPTKIKFKLKPISIPLNKNSPKTTTRAGIGRQRAKKGAEYSGKEDQARVFLRGIFRKQRGTNIFGQR